MILRTFLVLYAALFYSCGTNYEWEEFRARGLNPDGNYEQLIFINDSIGYLGGSETIPIQTDNNFSENRAVLYTTTDKGKEWRGITLNYKGSITKIFAFNDTLILLLEHITSDTNCILRSIDDGKNWTKIFTFPRSSTVRDIFFCNSNHGKIILENNNFNYLMHYYDNWDTVAILPRYFLLNNRYRYYTYNLFKDAVVATIADEANPGKAIGIQLIETDGQESNEIIFDKPYSISSTTRGEDQLYFTAEDSTGGKLIKYSNSGLNNIELGQLSNYTPQQVFAFGNTIIVIGFRPLKDVALPGIVHSLLISKDEGKTWKLEKIPNPLSSKPAFLYRDKFFVSYALQGRFQLRE